jgi:MSHA type pilus biogenesis protein MshL
VFKYLIFILIIIIAIPVYSQEETSTQDEIKVAKGERISLDLKGIDIIELFRILSLKTGQTIVPSRGVSGRVNVFLNNLTLEDTLDVILISQDLACDTQGNILYIMTKEEYQLIYGKLYIEKRNFKSCKLKYAQPANVFNAISQLKSDIGKVIVDESTGTILLMDIPEKLALMEKSINDLDKPKEMQIFDLNYAKSDDAKAQLASVITPGVGRVVVDERSAKAVVTDLPERMKEINKIVKALDEESRQVYIEGEIVQITLKNEFQRGIDWEKVLSGVDDLDFKGVFPVAASFTPSPLLSADYLKMVVGTLATDKYTSTLTFLQTFGDIKILSQPRIAVVNNQEAKIMVGSREAYVTQTLSQAEASTVTSESIEFIDVGVKLNVVPTINKEGFITMKIKPEISSVRETLTTSLGSTIPIVETSEAETVVKVKDGTMVMIAGLIKEDKRDERSGVPFLSQIPIIGNLFGTRSTLTKKTELVVFITPHIISGRTAVAGSEPEKVIPADILPESVVRSIISKKVDEMISSTADGTASGKAAQMSETLNKAEEEMRQKLKGTKEY